MRLIEEARAQHKKDVRDAKRSATGRERTAAGGGDGARIAAALAADRAERAAATPVSHGALLTGFLFRVSSLWVVPWWLGAGAARHHVLQSYNSQEMS